MNNEIQFNASLKIKAAQDGSRKVRIIAYSGAPMLIAGVGNVVIDLDSAELGRCQILRNHDPESHVGSGEARRDGKTIIVEGMLSGATERGAELLRMLEDGMRFEASVGGSFDPGTSEELTAGQTATVSGDEFKAGSAIVVARKFKIREVSLLALGADAETELELVASQRRMKKENQMSENKELELQAAEMERRADISESARNTTTRPSKSMASR